MLPDRMEAAGCWRAEADFPPPGAERKTLFLGGDAQLTEMCSGQGSAELHYHPQVGMTRGLWSGGIKFGLPGDQRPDEALSLTFTSAPLSDDLTILGHARVNLHLACEAPVMGYVACLCDVAPDGTSSLVAKGVMNATRRKSLVHPEPVPAGEIFPLEIEIDCTAWKFCKGHSIRLSISNGDFPNLWPTPYLANSQVYWGETFPSCISLPVAAPQGSREAVQFEPSPSSVSSHAAQADPPLWRATRDFISGRSRVEIGFSDRWRVDARHVIQHSSQAAFEVDERSPAHACSVGTFTGVIESPGGEIRAVSNMRLESNREHFILTISLEVRQNGLLHFQRHWSRTYPRQLL